MDIIAEVCPDLFIDELENLPFGDAGPDASESGYLEHIERKKLDRLYIFDLNLMASPTYPNVQSVKKVEGLCLELYQRNPDDFYAKLFVQRLSKFGGEYTLASDVFGVVEDAALGRRAILDQGQMACREEAAASHGLRAPPMRETLQIKDITLQERVSKWWQWRKLGSCAWGESQLPN